MRTPDENTRLRRTMVALGLFVSLGCTLRRPQVFTPVRVDTVGSVGLSSLPAMPRHVETILDDPLHRIDRMDWPGPNVFRSASGAPGSEYWQQRADYTIAAVLDTSRKVLSGTVSIRYTNNSPDTLRFLWLQLDQNLYRPGSKGSALFAADSRWGVRGFMGGYDLRALQVNAHSVVGRIDDTMMRIDLDSPIAPRGGTATVSMEYSFAIPEHGSDRMGRDSTLYEIAQWYPRMAVYDDVRGWNTDPYLGQGEFYLEYGDIDYSITVPAGYVVAGTGTLVNRAEVLTPTEIERTERAARSTTTVSVITADEANAARTHAVAGTKTWHYRAERVRDAAWAAAPDFRWDATSWNGVACNAFYEFPKAGRAWQSGAEMGCWTIRNYSESWMRYPYPQVTGVAGPVGGMEYPEFVMVHYGSDDPMSIFSTLDHEIGHQWFPMIVGSNERRYAWQDEGINTYQNAFALERRTPGSNVFPAYVENWRHSVLERTQSPLMTPADQIEPSGLGAVGYRKPAAVLLTLRDNVIGRETMDRAFREYVHRWAFKHPTPADFFRTIEDVSGADLSWFWNAFFYGTDVLDIAVSGVAMRQEEGQTLADISLRRLTSIPFPVTMRLKFLDGSTIDVSLPVEIWAHTTEFVASVPVKGRVTGVRLWPQGTVPDWNSANDVWGDAPPPDPVLPSTAGGRVPPIRSSTSTVP